MNKYNELPKWINSNYIKANEAVTLYNFNNPIYYKVPKSEISKYISLDKETAIKIKSIHDNYFSHEITKEDYELEKKGLKIIFFVLFTILGYMLSIHDFQLLKLIINLIEGGM